MNSNNITIDKAVNFLAWFFIPLYPIILIITFILRFERASGLYLRRNNSNLHGKTWAERRRNNMYVSLEIIAFITTAIIYFYFLENFRHCTPEIVNSCSNGTMVFCFYIVGILLIFIVPAILYKIFNKYENHIAMKNKKLK